MSYANLLTSRRSIYHIGRNTPVTAEEVTEKLQILIPTIPTAYHVESSRLIVASGQLHEKLWDTLHDSQKAFVDPERYEAIAPRFEQAKRGVGILLFFEDRAVVDEMPTSPERQAAYKEQNSAMLTFASWLLLADLGLGASLHHFNIGYDLGYDKVVRDLLDLPETYELMAEMPFGSIEAQPDEKARVSGDERVKLYLSLSQNA